MAEWDVQGSGIKPGTRPRTCNTCNGAGVVMQVVRTPLGMLQQQSACPTCQGTGEIIDEYCGTCSGRGRVQKNKQLKITIPAGVDNGSRCGFFFVRLFSRTRNSRSTFPQASTLCFVSRV